MPAFDQNTQPTYTVWLNGPAGSGKTRAALGFPKVLAVTFDPTGLDIVHEPENLKLRENLVWICPMNGLSLTDIFAYTEEPNEGSLYGAIALAKKLKKEGKVDTILLDGFTYLAAMKWDQICQDEAIETRKGGLDTQRMYGRLGTYLSQLCLQNFLPLAPRFGLNALVTCHVQRESKNHVEGVEDEKNPAYATSKRQVNLKSDLSPQVLGSFRQQVEGLPSAVLYMDSQLEPDKDNKETLQYYAYCKKTFVPSLDSEVAAKNRLGLPARLKLTNASLYKTLLSKSPAAVTAKGTSEQTVKG